MAFTDSISAIPFAPTTNAGTGFLPPLLRALGHILYLTGCIADERVTVTDAEANTELQHAQEHWNARTGHEALSASAAALSSHISDAIGFAITEYPGWDDTHRVSNLRNLSHRILAYSAYLDRELIGLTGSDPGSAL